MEIQISKSTARWASISLAALVVVVGGIIYVSSGNSGGSGSAQAKVLAQEGIVAFKAGQYGLAAQLFDQEIQAAGGDAGSKAVGYYNLGSVLIRQRQTAQARDYFSQATSLSPSFALAWMNLAMSERALGHTADALVAYNKLLVLQPTNAQGLFGSGVIMYEQGQHTAGIYRIKAALKLQANLIASLPKSIKLQ